jgi:hypothetical protein
MAAPRLSVAQPQAGHRPALIGLICGVSAALPMYAWQGHIPQAAAVFVIAGYTAWLAAGARGDVETQARARSFLRTLPINTSWRRLGRMVADPAFWWTLLFGNATVAGSVWFAGMRAGEVMVGIAAAWTLTAVCLSYGLTLLGPTTRCRRCGYQLAAHLDPSEPQQEVMCPECGRSWTKEQLCLVPPPIRKAA